MHDAYVLADAGLNHAVGLVAKNDGLQVVFVLPNELT